MKKIISLLLILTLVLSLTACGAKTETATPAETKPTETSAPAESKPAEVVSNEAQALTISDVWPDGSTVYFDVPAKAGGGSDLYTRYATAALSVVCPNVNFVVTNYDTAEVGAEHAKNAKPDGMTLTIAACTNMDNYLSGMSNVNPNEMTVLAKLNDGGPQAVIAKPGAPYTNLVELGEYINANPGEVIVGCSLGGTSQIILYSIIDAITGGNGDAVNYVQCSSEADKLTQTASSSIDIANCSIPNAQAYEADGKLIILGTVGPKVGTLASMSELVGIELPETFKSTREQGVDFSWDAGFYILGPAGISDEIAAAINAAMMEAAKDPAFIEGMGKMAAFLNSPDLSTTRADWAAEWEFQSSMVESLGWSVR